MRIRFEPILVMFLMVTIALTASCSGGQLPTAPSDQDVDGQMNVNGQVVTSGRSCLGLWEFYIDPENESISFVPMRGARIHMNGVAFMEPPAGISLAIDQVVDITSEQITVDIAISHPYPMLDVAAAFDVCGILISRGSVFFPLSTILFFADEGDLRLLNADGYTRWWNPVEFPPNLVQPQFGYVDGLLGRPHSIANYDTTLNGYKYFATDLIDPEAPLSELDTARRGVLEPGTTCIRRYEIAYTPGNLVFNYAVDANWAVPDTSGPSIEIPDDFPWSANRPEAYRIELQNVVNTLAYNETTGMASGELAMSVYAYDWFNAEENMACTYPQNNELMGYCNPDPSITGDGYAAFDFTLVPMFLESTDDILVWLSIDCEVRDYQGALPFELQSSYFQEWFTVAAE